MDQDKQIKIRLAIEDLNNDFCHYLDHGKIAELVALFCQDALYSHGDRVCRGADEIRKLFQVRKNSGNRISRHMQTGLRLKIVNEVQVAGQSVCMTFAADAVAPVNQASPYLVADFIDEYSYCSDGRWRIKKRHIERIFVAPDNTGPVGR